MVKLSKDETAQVAQVRKLRNLKETENYTEQVTPEQVTIFSHLLSKRHDPLPFVGLSEDKSSTNKITEQVT